MRIWASQIIWQFTENLPFLFLYSSEFGIEGHKIDTCVQSIGPMTRTSKTMKVSFNCISFLNGLRHFNKLVIYIHYEPNQTVNGSFHCCSVQVDEITSHNLGGAYVENSQSTLQLGTGW